PLGPPFPRRRPHRSRLDRPPPGAKDDLSDGDDHGKPSMATNGPTGPSSFGPRPVKATATLHGHDPAPVVTASAVTPERPARALAGGPAPIQLNTAFREAPRTPPRARPSPRCRPQRASCTAVHVSSGCPP